ncbi:MAG: hypothetical protein R2771_14890 [Saprospiraceae bacterium]
MTEPEGWDGSYKGSPMSPGAYIYHVHWEATRFGKLYQDTYTGQVTLLR